MRIIASLCDRPVRIRGSARGGPAPASPRASSREFRKWACVLAAFGLLIAAVAPAAAARPHRRPQSAPPQTPAPPPARPSGDAQKTEAQLEAVKSEIERVAAQVSNEEVQKTRLAQELRGAELSVGKAREGWRVCAGNALSRSAPHGAGGREEGSRGRILSQSASRSRARCGRPT